MILARLRLRPCEKRREINLSLPDGLTRLAAHPAVAISLLPPASDASFTDPPVKSIDFEDEPESKIQNPKSAILDGALVDLPCQLPLNYALAADQLAADLANWLRDGYAIVVATHQEHRMAEMLGAAGLPIVSGDDARQGEGDAPTGVVLIRRAELNEGVALPDARLAILTDGELLGWQKQRRSVRRRQSPGQAVGSVGQLTPGDYVVHINHGVGRYTGLVRRDVQGVEREFLQVDYAGADKLFVPVDQLDRVQKYMGLDDGAPEVHRLGGGGNGSGSKNGPASPPKSWLGNCCSFRHSAPVNRVIPLPPTPRGSAKWRRASPGWKPPTSCALSTR